MPDSEDLPARVQKGKDNKWGRAARHVDITRWPFATPYWSRSAPPELRRQLYRDWITNNDSDWANEARSKLSRLRGKTLACTCEDGQPCHGDVLIEMANAR